MPDIATLIRPSLLADSASKRDSIGKDAAQAVTTALRLALVGWEEDCPGAADADPNHVSRARALARRVETEAGKLASMLREGEARSAVLQLESRARSMSTAAGGEILAWVLDVFGALGLPADSLLAVHRGFSRDELRAVIGAWSGRQLGESVEFTRSLRERMQRRLDD